uniref:RapA2 cadherin-like domain-containing protein n=1 Tax=Eutreptiella gymnastica TaxID=73025 RepID=A0A7S1NEQ2_9EUGL|mmetsp:Transcript_24289/g.43867  ORF Transcript_24289/g.43867 Transcript_24289/m.43867 type:complete len:680 (+) Transcript_24289:41-2080(+)
MSDPGFASKPSILLGFLFLMTFWGIVEANPTAYCYITISDGTEYCYYYPSTGYECETGPAQDATKRNMSACNYMGLCYVPLAGNNEVCYYTAPYGYDCYYELIPAYVANMTHCDDLKANSAPEILFMSGDSATVNEDQQLLVKDIMITDLDARESEKEGKGFMDITLQATNGYVGFDPSSPGLTAQEAADAAAVLDPTLDKLDGGVEFVTGNGSLATNLQFYIRMDPLQKLFKSLVVKGKQDFNTGINGDLLTLMITANDQGNTGGTAEITTKTMRVTVNAVNDPPVITAPNQPGTFEDTQLTLSGLKVSDVDVNDGTPKTLQLTMSVTKGTLSVTVPDDVTVSVTTSAQGVNTLVMINTLSILNAALATAKYQPNHNENDDTGSGVDVLTIQVDDLAHHGQSFSSADRIATATIDLHVIAVNDHPYILIPGVLSTDEDTPLVGLNITAADVDTTDGLTVVLSVVSGTLSSPNHLPATSLSYTGNLTFMNSLFETITYTPNANFNGQDTLTIDLNDGQSQNNLMPTMYVQILVDAVNDPPTITWTCPTACAASAVPTLTVSAAQSRIFSGASDTAPRVSVADVDSADKLVQMLISTTHGTVKLSQTTGLSFTVPAAYDPLAPPDLILAMGTIADLDAAINSLTYTRVTSGVDDLVIAVNDLKNQGKGLPGTAVTLMNIN